MVSPDQRVRETAKQRANRIPLDYHRTRTPLEKLKWGLTAAVATLTLLYVVWIALGVHTRASAARIALSPGRLASAHQMWESQCEACHRPGEPLRDDAGFIGAVAELLDVGSPRESRLPTETSGQELELHRNSTARGTQRCETCHLGPAHHGLQKSSEVPSCASCHRDHQGALADLRRVADSQCLTCHREIARHRQSPESPGSIQSTSGRTESVARDVPSWREHPRSRTKAQPDPSRLRFNHALHLMPGQFPPAAKPSALKRFGAVDPAVWTRFGATASTTPDTVIQLTCAACHELETLPEGAIGGDIRAFGSAPSNGQYMQPIQYSRHCAPCHTSELTISIPVVEGTASRMIPHGLPPPDIERQIWGAIRQPTTRTTELKPPRPLPGGRSPTDRGDDGAVELSVRVAHALRQLSQVDRCGKCHLYSDRNTDANVGDSQPQIDPTSVPSYWWRTARFDHAAHRAVRCEDCHPTAISAAAGGGTSIGTRDGEPLSVGKPPLDDHVPMLPDIDLCQRCHGNGTARSARADCVTCHDYHATGHSPLDRALRRQSLPTERRQAVSAVLGTGDVTNGSTTKGAP